MSKLFQFNVFDTELQDYLDNQNNISEFLRNLVEDYRLGKLVTKSDIEKDADYDQKMKSEKLKKIVKENMKLDLDNRIKLIRELNFSPAEAIEIIKAETLPEPKGLVCIDKCGWSTVHTDTLNFQINRLTDHMQIYHKRGLTEEEAEHYTRMLT